MIDKIIAKVFGSENFNADINTKKDLQDALEKAVVEVSKEPGSKFARPVHGVAANYLGRWLGTNINVEYARSGSTELKNKGASVIAAKEVLTKTLTPTEKEKEELQAPVEQPKAEEPTSEAPASQSDKKDLTKVLDGTYTVTEESFDAFSEQIQNMNKRLVKKGIPTINLERVGEKMSKGVGEYQYRAIKLITFKVQVPSLALPGGWKFVARVDHTDMGNIIVGDPNSGHEGDLHQMFGKSQPSHCDHCGKTRKRTSTYVVTDDKGKLKRIGRQCLKDYLPGGEKEVQKLIDFAEYWSRVAQGLIELPNPEQGDGGDGMGGGGGGKQYYSVNTLLSLGFCFADKFGFMSKKKATEINQEGDRFVTTTADDVTEALTGQLESKLQRAGGNPSGRLELEAKTFKEWREDGSEVRKKYDKMVKDTLAWAGPYIQSQVDNKNNPMRDYFQNLSVIVNATNAKGENDQNQYITDKHVGIAMSLIPLYKKYQQQAEAQKDKPAAKVSDYVGVVGYPIGELSATDKRKMKKEGFAEKLDKFPYNGPIDVTVVSSGSYERASYSYYDSGVSYRYTMVDDNGNVFVYFSSNNLGLEKDQKAKIVRAKVKDQKEYTPKNGGTPTKQTYLTRADIQGIGDN